MTLFWNKNTQATSTRPTSRTTSNLWEHPDLAAQEGWLVVVEGTAPTLAFGQYTSGASYTDNGDGTATRTQTISTYTLLDMQSQLQRKARDFIDFKMTEKWGGPFVQIAVYTGVAGAAAEASYKADQTTYVQAYATFSSAVNAATTLADLEKVYNTYPQLQ